MGLAMKRLFLCCVVFFFFVNLAKLFLEKRAVPPSILTKAMGASAIGKNLLKWFFKEKNVCPPIFWQRFWSPPPPWWRGGQAPFVFEIKFKIFLLKRFTRVHLLAPWQASYQRPPPASKIQIPRFLPPISIFQSFIFSMFLYFKLSISQFLDLNLSIIELESERWVYNLSKNSQSQSLNRTLNLSIEFPISISHS